VTPSDCGTPAESFDRVVFSLVLHHLDRTAKRKALAEAWRVLRPAGSLHVADIGPARGRLARLAATPIRVLDGERVIDNLDGLLPQLVEAAGFRLSPPTSAHRTRFGAVTFLHGRKTAARDTP
jgi:SAM-dependent methyltransferase